MISKSTFSSLILSTAAFLAVTGCVSLNSVSMTQIPAQRPTPVKAESSRLIILGLNFDNDYVEQVRSELKGKCSGGQIRGILTKDEVITYFLFVQRRRVTAEGFCSKNSDGEV